MLQGALSKIMIPKSLTIRPACIQKYCSASSPSAFAVSTPLASAWEGEDTWHLLATSLDVM
jgi:hypothetical protein